MAVGTTTTTANALKQYWADMFIENFYAASSMKGLTKKVKVPKGNGKVVWFVGVSKVNPVGASASEGADPTARSSAATRISATIAQYNNLIKNSNLFMDTAIDGVKEQIIKDLGKDAAKTWDDAVLATALGGTNKVFAGAATHRSNIVSASSAVIRDVRKAVRLLELSSTPRFADGFYVGLVHPDVAFDIQSDTAWQDIVRYRDTVKYDIPNEIGRIWGVRFALAPTIPVLTNSGSAAVDVYRTLVFGPDFMGEAELHNLNIVINEPGKGTELGMFNAYGYTFSAANVRLHEAAGVRIESSASLE